MVHYLLNQIVCHFVNKNDMVQIDYLITLVGQNRLVYINKLNFFNMSFLGFFTRNSSKKIVNYNSESKKYHALLSLKMDCMVFFFFFWQK